MEQRVQRKDRNCQEEKHAHGLRKASKTQTKDRIRLLSSELPPTCEHEVSLKTSGSNLRDREHFQKPSTYMWHGNLGNLGHKQKPVKTGEDPGTILFGRFAEEKAITTRLKMGKRGIVTVGRAARGLALSSVRICRHGWQ